MFDGIPNREILARLGIDLDALRAKHTDPATHEWDEERVGEELARLLNFDAEARAKAVEVLAAQMLRASDRAQRPNFKQPDLFEGTKIIPLGENRRIRLADATIVQIAEWWSIVIRNHSTQAEAHARQSAFYSRLLSAWSRHPKAVSAGDVAQAEFGWSPENGE